MTYITIKKGGKQYRALYCNTTFSRAFGLMLRRKQLALIELPFESKPLAGIHMLFMLFPLDIYWLDKQMKVISMRKNLKPFCYANAERPAKYVLEAPVGVLRLKIGDKITAA